MGERFYLIPWDAWQKSVLRDTDEQAQQPR